MTKRWKGRRPYGGDGEYVAFSMEHAEAMWPPDRALCAALRSTDMPWPRIVRLELNERTGKTSYEVRVLDNAREVQEAIFHLKGKAEKIPRTRRGRAETLAGWL